MALSEYQYEKSYFNYLVVTAEISFLEERYCVRHCIERTEVVKSDENFISLLSNVALCFGWYSTTFFF